MLKKLIFNINVLILNKKINKFYNIKYLNNILLENKLN